MFIYNPYIRTGIHPFDFNQGSYFKELDIF